MGCWNETCFMSHLTIHINDETVVFILAPSLDVDKEGVTCYHDDKYVPLSFPIAGKYDDYGGLEAIQNKERHERILNKVNKYFTENDEGDGFVPYEFTTLETFLRDIVSRHVYIALSGRRKRRLMLAYIHKQLYLDLLNNMANRIPYNQTEPINTLYLRRVSEALVAYKSVKEEYGLSLGTFCETAHLNPSKYRHLEKIADEYWETNDAQITRSFADFLLWNQVMMHSRIGYCINSGCAGQDSEYAIPRIIANFIMSESEKYLKAYQEDEPETSSDIFEETIYWYN